MRAIRAVLAGTGAVTLAMSGAGISDARGATAELAGRHADSVLSVRGAVALYYRGGKMSNVTVRGYYIPFETLGPEGEGWETGYLLDRKVSGPSYLFADSGLVVYGPRLAATRPGPHGPLIPVFRWVDVRGSLNPTGAIARHSRKGRPLLWETSWTYAPTARKARR